ncbi:WD repeat-containing protein 11-like [Cyprinus carpio]|uniref:WD repeat-containing protein 11-like n=1 Tax=Cyprinus carpio TaxID=7962 RepID=A0A9Q9X2W3_CYPCA|nr:WD repeat-containing protein 11-like [Cyprinus carpio]
MNNGCVRVLEMAMKSLPVIEWMSRDLTDPVWCPYLLLPRAALTLKAFLLLQPWSDTFTMDITHVDYKEKDEIKGLIQEQLNSLSNDIKSVLQGPNLNLLQRSASLCLGSHRFQLERVRLQEVKRSSYEHTKKSVLTSCCCWDSDDPNG